MNEGPMNTNTLIPAMQIILNASDPKEVCSAVNEMNEYLAVVPVKQVLSQSGQFVDIVEQTLMDAIKNNSEHMLPHTMRECQIAFNDWKILRRPVLPAPVMSPAARTIFGIVEDTQSLSEYEVGRQALWAQLQALDDAEQETVSGYISQKLSVLLVEKVLPELVTQTKNVALNRQYDLWDQLAKCRQYGLEDLAVYFLRVDRNRVKVLLPPAMEFHNDVKDYYSCARTFSVLYYQIPICQRKELSRLLLHALEDEVMSHVLKGEANEAAETIQDLYLAMRAEDHICLTHYWENVCYARHALDKNTKNNKEEN